MRTIFRVLLSLAVAALLLFLLARWGGVSAEEFVDVWRRMPLETYLAATLLHLAIYLLRAVRFRILLPRSQRPGLEGVFAVSSAHNLASCVLPAKIGEATWVLYLKKCCGVPAGMGLASLVVSRLLDLAVMLAMLSCSCLALASSGILEGEWAVPLGVFTAIASACLLALTFRVDWAVDILAVPVALTRRFSPTLGDRLSTALEKFRTAMRMSVRGGKLWQGLAISIPLWFGTFGFFLMLAWGFGMATELGYLGGWFGCTWALLANLLPINGFAGAGTQELGWVVGFDLVGVPRDVALKAGLGVHLIHIFNVTILGAAGHLVMWLRSSSLSSLQVSADGSVGGHPDQVGIGDDPGGASS